MFLLSECWSLSVEEDLEPLELRRWQHRFLAVSWILFCRFWSTFALETFDDFRAADVGGESPWHLEWRT
jgi:hypothetical protein